MPDRTDLPAPDVIDGQTYGIDGHRWINGYTADTVRKLIAEAVAAEREACIAFVQDANVHGIGTASSMAFIIAGLRARGTT